MLRVVPVVLTMVLIATSCHKAPHADPSPSTESSAVSSGSERHATAPAPQNPRDLGSLFKAEADARPTSTLKVEDALAAFRRQGIALDKVRQHLARPYGARYCVGAKSGTQVALSICEYIDPAAAQAGAESSKKIRLANREIRINRATSLTVREVEKTPEADALSARLFDSFAKL